MQSERRSFLRKLGLTAIAGITGTVITQQEALAKVVGKEGEADRHFCYMYHYKEGIFPSEETFLEIVIYPDKTKKEKVLYKFSGFGVEQNTIDKINKMSLDDLLENNSTFSKDCLRLGLELINKKDLYFLEKIVVDGKTFLLQSVTYGI